MKLAKGFAGAAAFMICSLAYAGQYEYRINSIAPNTIDTNCGEKIQEVSRRFAEMTGVQVTSAACYVNEFKERFLDGVISYNSENIIKFTKYLQYANYGIEETALYRSEQACRDALPDQTALFATQTGLTPHISYCYRKSMWTEERWHLQIEAAGESEIKHYIMGVYLRNEPAQGYEAHWEEVSTNLTNRGLTISNAAIVNGGIFNRLTIGYYAAERYHIYHSDDLRLESAEACARAKERALVAFAELPNAPISIFCGKADRGMWGAQLNIYTLETRVGNAADYEHQVLPGFYESIEACKQGRDDQITRLESRGVNVIEAFCGVDSRNRVILNGFIRKQ